MSEPHKPDVKLYMMVFGALAILTVVTVLVSYWHLPMPAAVLVGLMIATVKASLVAAFFMHLKGERKIIYGLLGMTAFFTLILFVLPIRDSRDVAPRQQHIAVTDEADSSARPAAAWEIR